MLRRALVMALGCGAAAFTVPWMLGGSAGLAPPDRGEGASDRPLTGEAAQRAVSQLPKREAGDPGDDTTVFDSTLDIHAGAFNQFFVRAAVNGIELPFVIDTGASMVALKREDAALVGIDVGSLRWDVPVTTANGNTYAARVILGSVRLERISEYNVAATVMQQRTDSPSLLGMSFLSRLKSWQIHDGVLSIRY